MQTPNIGDLYKKGGSNWRVIDNTAGIITIRNGKGHEQTLHLSELKNYRKVK